MAGVLHANKQTPKKKLRVQYEALLWTLIPLYYRLTNAENYYHAGQKKKKRSYLDYEGTRFNHSAELWYCISLEITSGKDQSIL